MGTGVTGKGLGKGVGLGYGARLGDGTLAFMLALESVPLSGRALVQGLVMLSGRALDLMLALESGWALAQGLVILSGLALEPVLAIKSV